MVTSETKKTSTITFRLNDDTITKLRNESKNKDISTNTLVNQALKKFLDWDVFQPQMGLVSINKTVFVKIFGNLKEQEIIKMASRIGKDEVYSVSLFMKGKIDVVSFMSWFVMQMVNSSVQVSHSVDNDTHTYVFKHDLGKNWSLYYKTILEIIFEELFSKNIHVKCDKFLFHFQFIDNVNRHLVE